MFDLAFFKFFGRKGSSVVLNQPRVAQTLCPYHGHGNVMTLIHHFHLVIQVEEACDDLFKVEHNLKDLQSMIYCLVSSLL